MDVRVGDESFVPFVPRQLIQPRANSQGEREQSSVPENNGAQCEPEPNTKGEGECEVGREATPQIEATAEVEALAEIETSSGTKAQTRTDPTEGKERPCDHALEIRHEAIRLAAVACGRALRHAVLLHPSVIAAFVDDALAAAGLPQHARIRVHPGSIAHINARGHESIGDDDLSPGDVVIECNGITVGADTNTRASLLVTAAAET